MVQALKTRIVTVDPRALKLLEINARFMSKFEFENLVNNIRKDGCLTSLPLVCEDDDGNGLLVLSGNHRTRAAIECGLETIEVMQIINPLSEDQKLAIQLSHNAIAGKDEINTLQSLYDMLSFEGKEYSGLNDTMFNLEDLSLCSIPDVHSLYTEVKLLFLPADYDAYHEALKALDVKTKGKIPPELCVALNSSFEEFLNVLSVVKERYRIINSSTAMITILRKAMEKIDDEIQREQTDTGQII